MKEEIKESHLPKSEVKAKEKSTLEYLIGTLVITIVYAVVTSNLGLVTIIGALIPLALIAGVITFFNKGRYAKNLFWTSLVIMTISSFGQLSLEKKENRRANAPYIDKLIKEGHDILKLDLADKDNQGLKNELSKEYKKQCGTPWLIDASNGNQVCGYREKDIIEKWVNGEDIPAPPKPNGVPPRPPFMNATDEEVKTIQPNKQ